MAVPRATRRRAGAGPLAAILGCCGGCTTIDPGTNFNVADLNYDSDYFYCHVEPEFIVAKHCGPGDPSIDPPNGCHFAPSAVSGMFLVDHAPVACGGGDHPTDRTQVGTGSAPQANFEAVSFVMLKGDYASSPLLVRPSGPYHPRVVFDRADPQVTMLLRVWASR